MAILAEKLVAFPQRLYRGCIRIGGLPPCRRRYGREQQKRSKFFHNKPLSPLLLILADQSTLANSAAVRYDKSLQSKRSSSDAHIIKREARLVLNLDVTAFAVPRASDERSRTAANKILVGPAEPTLIGRSLLVQSISGYRLRRYQHPRQQTGYRSS